MMMRSPSAAAAAMASKVLRQLISSSRPSSIHYLRPIVISATAPDPINPIVRYHHHHQLFFSDPNSPFTGGVQFRNYATSGRSTKVVVDDDDEFNEDSDDEFGDDEVFDHDEFVDDLDESDDDDDDDDDEDEEST